MSNTVIHTTHVSYTDRVTHLEGFVAYCDCQKRPAILLCHAWAGRDAFICQAAETIASWGYVGFALDMYGKGILGTSKEENSALKKPFLEDRHLLQQRVLTALESVRSLPYVDANRIAVLGFGFGGICALDLARTGANVQGVISIYGHFTPPPAALVQPLKAKILILHGHDDPVTSLEELLCFTQELSRAHVDWQAHLFGNTVHAFTTPSAQDLASGILYNPLSAQRAWHLIQDFCEEVLHK